MAAGEGAQSQASAEQIARLRGRYGLDDPLWMQYLKWLGGILTGDWGASFNTGRRWSRRSPSGCPPRCC